ncbi:transposase, Ptta/En/Spm [Tanacetum coccineum]
MGSVTGQDVDQGQSDGAFNVSHLHRIGDDGEDVTSDMEHDGTTMKRTIPAWLGAGDCMISTKAENEQQHNKEQSQSNGHSTNETNDANSSQMDTKTNEHFDNQNELGAKLRVVTYRYRPFVNKIESGTKSFARLAEKEATKNNEVHPTRGKLYQISRTRKDGSIVNDKAAQVVASLQVIANDSTNTQGIQEDDWTNDDLSKVKGPEKRGYVRCVGKMLSLRNNGASSSTSSQTVEQRLAQTEDVLYTLVNLLKDPTTNSNVPDILRSMNIQIHDNFSPGQNNFTNGNLGNSNQRSSVADQNIGTQTNLS